MNQINKKYSYVLKWEANCIHLKYEGDITINDLFKASSSITRDSRYGELKFAISDFLNVKSIKISDSDIEAISTLDVIPSIWNPTLKFSVISKNSKLQEIILRYIDLMKLNEWDIKLFEKVEDAIKWGGQCCKEDFFHK